MKMNKRGIGTASIVVAMLGVLILMFGGMMYLNYSGQKTQETIVTPSQIALTEQTITSSQTGDAATLKLIAYDMEASSKSTPVAVSAYVVDDAGNLVANGRATNAGAGASALSIGTFRNTKLKVIAFNGTSVGWYPDINQYETGFTMDTVSKDYTVNVYKITNELQVRLKDKISSSTTVGTSCTDTGCINATGASASSTSSNVEALVRNNGTYEAYNFGVVYFDVPVTSNISVIDIKGTATVANNPVSSVAVIDASLDAKELLSIKNLNDFMFEIDADSSKAGEQPVMLEQSDEIDLGTIAITVNGNGCEVSGQEL